MTDCECDCCQHWKAERTDMRTELAAKRERYAKLEAHYLEAMGDWRTQEMEHGEKIAKLEAENARLRAAFKPFEEAT